MVVHFSLGKRTRKGKGGTNLAVLLDAPVDVIVE